MSRAARAPRTSLPATRGRENTARVDSILRKNSARRHLAEHPAALGLVGLRRLDQRDHHGLGRHLVVLHHRVGDVLAERGLLLVGAVADGVDDDLGHGCSSCRCLRPYYSPRNLPAILPARSGVRPARTRRRDGRPPPSPTPWIAAI